MKEMRQTISKSVTKFVLLYFVVLKMIKLEESVRSC